MLSDFLSLETMYGKSEAAMFLEDALEEYGEHSVNEAIHKGHLVFRVICIGPDCGRCMCWLSNSGRHYVSTMN